MPNGEDIHRTRANTVDDHIRVDRHQLSGAGCRVPGAGQPPMPATVGKYGQAVTCDQQFASKTLSCGRIIGRDEKCNPLYIQRGLFGPATLTTAEREGGARQSRRLPSGGARRAPRHAACDAGRPLLWSPQLRGQLTRLPHRQAVQLGRLEQKRSLATLSRCHHYVCASGLWPGLVMTSCDVIPDLTRSNTCGPVWSYPRRRSIASQISLARSTPSNRAISCRPVGDVTLISVK